MKKTLGILLIISAILITFAILYTKYFDTSDKTATNSDSSVLNLQKENFVWGANTSCYQIDGYVEETADKQIEIINDLKINTVRMFLERRISLEPFEVIYDEKANDSFVEKLKENNKDIVMIVDGDIINSATIDGFDQESAGYQMGKYAASRYKGKIKYYQIANEVTGTSIKPSDPSFTGPTFKGDYNVEYSTERYRALLGWLKGMQKGIRESDEQAKIVISGHWHLYFIIDKLIKDGIDPDVIGWAWYSDDGDDITERDLGEGKSFNLAAKLNEFGRDVWIIELNSTKGSYNESKKRNDEEYQSNFLKKMVPNLIETGLIKGILIYTLFDTPSFADGRDESETHWGLVNVSKNKNGSVVFKTKKAFSTFRSLIEKYSN
ncbi:MAG: hypothetical protein BWY43_00513 [candidate division WS2 bacterium ADurb.Bin280]|uniref:Uncharacterized protein n=1 Tax=candidate division WS2 bacterium ADurb.Bin280 TaxID=1852829 RepID=A0A1V5SD51_9BACT|nr:MAG: hypothetical protein BWY43_00513 [candidate division WS2 bacterium ADurb.Bin280]